MLYEIGYGFARRSAPFTMSGEEDEITFAPTQISSLGVWYDASDESTITENGGSVSQWSDKSGNDYHAVQGTSSSQPSTGILTVNGLNALRFVNGTCVLGINSMVQGAIGNAASSTIFGVAVKADASETTDAIVAAGANYRLVFTANGAYFRFGNSGGSVSVSATMDTNAHILVGQRDGATQSVYLDGGDFMSSNGNALDTSLSSFRIAHNDIDFNGAICEILIFFEALSPAQINQVGNYLADKWGITWSDLA